MEPNNPKAKNYLLELYQMTAGDVSVQVSMFEVGAAMGLEKTEAGKIAEDLIGDGLVEIKTLSGGIGITTQGIEQVQAAGVAGPTAATDLDLGNAPVLEERGKNSVETVLKEIKACLSQNSTAYERLEEMVIDLKTIEVQLLSPRPKTAIIREVLRSLHSSLDSTDRSDLAKKIENMIAS